MNKNKIKFSIIIPTYNCPYITRSIESVLNQSYKHWELLIIDNNSRKFFYKKIKSYKDKRIRYFRIQNKGIIAKSRNLGVKKSKYNWIAFLDSDDYWVNKKLENIRWYISNKKADLFYHNMGIDQIKSNNKKKYLYDGKLKINKPIFDNLILYGNKIPQSSVVVKKKLIKKVKLISEKKDLVTWEDFDLWIKISKITNKFYFIKKKLGIYWIGEKNFYKLKNYIKIINNFENHYNKEIFFIKKKYSINELDWINFTKFIYYLKSKNIKKSMNFFNKISKKEIIKKYKEYFKNKLNGKIIYKL